MLIYYDYNTNSRGNTKKRLIPALRVASMATLAFYICKYALWIPLKARSLLIWPSSGVLGNSMGTLTTLCIFAASIQ